MYPDSSDPLSNSKKKRVHGVILGGWPALDPACQNCTERRATWEKVSDMCVKSCCYIITCKIYRIRRFVEEPVTHSYVN